MNHLGLIKKDARTSHPIALLLALCFALAAPGEAEASKNFGYCAISTEELGFGTYTTGQLAPLDSSSIVALECVGDAHIANLKVSSGLYSSGGSRQMLGVAGTLLRYELYQDAQRTEPIRNVAGKEIKRGRRELVLYGRIPAQQEVRAGAYRDVITITLLP